MFEKLHPGMVLFDIHSYQMGSSRFRRLGKWEVRIITVDIEHRTAMVSWNGNPPERWHESRLRKLYTAETKAYREQEERRCLR